MKLLRCECHCRTEGPGSDLSGKGDLYSELSYKIDSHTPNEFVIKVLTNLPGGEYFKCNGAELKDGFIHLNSIVISSGTIEFELLAWELTYKIALDGPLELSEAEILFRAERP